MSTTMLFFQAILLSVFAEAKSNGGPIVTLNNGVKMPLVGAGVWQYNSSTAYQSILDAVNIGYKHIDTAWNYKNQDGVGKAMKTLNRSSIFLTTKVPGCGKYGMNMSDCYSATKKMYEDDLALLDTIPDMVLVHFPPTTGCDDCKPIQDQWKAMEEFYKQKKTRAIGVSNYCPKCLACLNETATVQPAINQFELHVGMGTDPIGLISYCLERNILPQAYSPLGNGSPDLIHGKITGDIGSHYNKSSVQIALKWIVQKGYGVLTKSTKPRNLAADIDIFDFNLTDAQMQTLDSQTKPEGTPSFMCNA